MKKITILLTILLILALATAYCDTPANRVAILDLTPRSTETGTTDFYSVKHICDTMGISYDIVLNPADLSGYPLTLIANTYNLTFFSGTERTELRTYVEEGGWLVASSFGSSEHANLFSLFGIEDATTTKSLYQITFDTEIGDPSFSFIDDPMEETISLGNPDTYSEIMQARKYQITASAEALGAYEDGSIAYVKNTYGLGRTYTLGVKFSEIIFRSQVNRDYGAGRVYTEGFEPTADVPSLLIRGIYEEIADVPLLKHTIPESHKSALIITHDVDADDSYANTIAFCQLEEPLGYHSSFFIETKYFGDWLDNAIYNADSIAALNTVMQLGYDIGSHSVGHFPDFATFLPGDPNVTYPQYQPYYNGISTTDGTIFGETKISKYLLDRDIGTNVISFRSGHLAFPYNLPEVLDDAEYLYDSSYKANDIMQNFPYFLVEESKIGGTLTNVLEIPLTISDNLLTPDTISEVVQSWTNDLTARYENFSPVVLLIHSSNTNEKITAETGLINNVSGYDLWKGDLTDYGKFWRNRLDMDYDWDISGSTLNIYITSTLSYPYTPLVFKDKGLISEIHLYYQPDGESTPVELEYEQSTKYGYVFIQPIYYTGLEIKEWGLY